MAATFKPPKLSKPLTLPLDRSLFELSTTCPGIVLANRDVGKALGAAKEFELRTLSGIKPVQVLDAERKVLILDKRRVSQPQLDMIGAKLDTIGLTYEMVEHPLLLGFDNFDIDDLIRAALPDDVIWMKAFTRIGHIIHVNLRREQEPHKALIGAIFLEKYRDWAKTVVNKTQEVEAEFRTLDLEVLAGEPSFETVSTENGCQFALDLRRVFWNPRQGTERRRLIERYFMPHRAAVYDLFAGIGPFAVPAAKRKCKVVANDLNPECVEYLRKNAKLNHCEAQLESIHCLDAKEFVSTVLGPHLRKVSDGWSAEEDMPSSAHAVMNLPGLAVDFLPAFVGCLPHSDTGKALDFPFWVHCYTFSKEDAKLEAAEVEDDTRRGERRRRAEAESSQRIAAAFPAYSQPEDYEIRESKECRHVAPSKFMVCVSLTLSEQLLTGAPSKAAPSPEPKRPKLQ